MKLLKNEAEIKLEDELKEAVLELNLVLAGKIKARNARDFMNQLKNEEINKTV